MKYFRNYCRGKKASNLHHGIRICHDTMKRTRTLRAALLLISQAANPNQAFLRPMGKLQRARSSRQQVVEWFRHTPIASSGQRPLLQHDALSDSYLENDLVAIERPGTEGPRLCAVRPDQSVVPLCRKEDDVVTDLYADPREFAATYWTNPSDDHVRKSYGEAYYGQRPVPSLGGGIGYGAEADDVWSVDEGLLQQVELDGVELPVLDVGIAHGEKARGGAF
jgi:hypothetical protein